MTDRGVWHTFRNLGPELLRFLEIITNGAFASHIVKADASLPDYVETDEDPVEQHTALHDRYGFYVDPEGVTQLSN